MRPVGEERKKALESVLTERFVKVHVKHITDGQVTAGYINNIDFRNNNIFGINVQVT